MDVSPPPFHSSSSWYVHWALWVAAFRSVSVRGTRRLPRYGGWGTSRRLRYQLPAFACFTPSFAVLPPDPSSAVLLSGDDFYLELVGGGISLPLSLQHHCLLLVSVSLSLLSLCLWTGPKKL